MREYFSPTSVTQGIDSGNIWDDYHVTTDAIVTNVTNTARFIYTTHMPGCTTWYIYSAEPISNQSRSNARVKEHLKDKIPWLKK